MRRTEVVIQEKETNPKQLISEFNSLPCDEMRDQDGTLDNVVPAGRIVNDDVVAATFYGMLKEVVLETIGGNTNSIHEYYWRLIEDLYHHLVDLAQAKRFYTKQIMAIATILNELKEEEHAINMWVFWESAINSRTRKIANDLQACDDLQRVCRHLITDKNLVSALLEVDNGFHNQIHRPIS